MCPGLSNHLLLVGWWPPANRIGLEIMVEQFIWIEFGTVRRQEDELYLVSVLVGPQTDLFGAVNRVAIKDQIDLNGPRLRIPPPAWCLANAWI